MKIYNTQGIVLIYAIFLTLMGVFIALGVLNLTERYTAESDIMKYSRIFEDELQKKADYAFKLSHGVNNDGDYFTDVLGCPQNITMSGATQRTEDIDTILTISGAISYCSGIHSGNPVTIEFNADLDDTATLEYQGGQITFGSGQTTGTLSDGDSTYVDANLSFPLIPDRIDDNLNSDNYGGSSYENNYYTDGYTDNDGNARLINYGYFKENTGMYNVFWSNDTMQSYIDKNTNNDDGINIKLGDVSDGYLVFASDKDFRLSFYRLDKNIYNTTKEFVITEFIEGEQQLSGSGYIQDDMSIAGTTENAYHFDFTTHDYVIFVENKDLDTGIYQIFGEQVSTGSRVYLTPINDSDYKNISYLSSHIILSEKGQPVGAEKELYAQKYDTSVAYFGKMNTPLPLYTIPGLVGWYDASDTSTITQTGGSVAVWNDKSPIGNMATQNVVGDRPTSGGDGLNGLNTVNFTEDYLQLYIQQNIRSVFFVVQNQNGSDVASDVTPIFGEEGTSNFSYTFLGTNRSDGEYDISIDGNIGDTGTVYFGGGIGVSGGNVNLGLTQTQVESQSIWYVEYDSLIPLDFIGALRANVLHKGNIDIGEFIMYDQTLNITQVNQIGNYLSNKWALQWRDL